MTLKMKLMSAALSAVVAASAVAVPVAQSGWQFGNGIVVSANETGGGVNNAPDPTLNVAKRDNITLYTASGTTPGTGEADGDGNWTTTITCNATDVLNWYGTGTSASGDGRRPEFGYWFGFAITSPDTVENASAYFAQNENQSPMLLKKSAGEYVDCGSFEEESISVSKLVNGQTEMFESGGYYYAEEWFLVNQSIINEAKKNKKDHIEYSFKIKWTGEDNKNVQTINLELKVDGIKLGPSKGVDHEGDSDAAICHEYSQKVTESNAVDAEGKFIAKGTTKEAGNSLIKINKTDGVTVYWKSCEVCGLPSSNEADTFKAYTFKFDADGGTLSGGIEEETDYEYIDGEALPEPTRKGYTFDGWYFEGADTKFVTVENDAYKYDGAALTKGGTLKAKWTEDGDTFEKPIDLTGWTTETGSKVVKYDSKYYKVPLKDGALYARISDSGFEFDNAIKFLGAKEVTENNGTETLTSVKDFYMELGDNANCSNDIAIASGTNVTIDLNEKTLTMTGKNIILNGDATLKVKGNPAATTGEEKIEFGSGTDAGTVKRVNANGTTELETDNPWTQSDGFYMPNFKAVEAPTEKTVAQGNVTRACSHKNSIKNHS